MGTIRLPLFLVFDSFPLFVTLGALSVTFFFALFLRNWSDCTTISYMISPIWRLLLICCQPHLFHAQVIQLIVIDILGQVIIFYVLLRTNEFNIAYKKKRWGLAEIQVISFLRCKWKLTGTQHSRLELLCFLKLKYQTPNMRAI